MVYLMIFILKIIENMLSTFRIILVSNGKKLLGSILIFLVSLVWIISSSMTIININIIGVLFFSFGSFIGSFTGILIEEKLAMGIRLIIAISSNSIEAPLRDNGYIVTTLNGKGIKGEKNVLLIVIKRKNLKDLIKTIKKYDKNALIFNENINL